VLPISYDTLVVTTPGLEPVTLTELAALGIVPAQAPQPGAIPVRVALQSLYTLNLNLRTASRITVQAAQFRARTFAELERRAKTIAWNEWLGSDVPVDLRVTCRKSKLYHSDAVAERVAEVIASRSRARVLAAEGDGERQIVFVRFLRDECTVRIDASGENLHRRGYRLATAKAPLRETLAAAMLLGSQWNPAAPLVDPFCGAGTIAIEGALLSRRIAPGMQRRFAFMRWPNYDASAWNAVRDAARENERPRAGAEILASDRDAGAVDATRANAERAGVAADLAVAVQPLSALQPPRAPGWLVTNPPYGVRVSERDDLRDLYAAFGRLVRERLAGWHVALLSAQPALDAQLKLPLREVLRTSNGGLTVRLVQRTVKREGDRESSVPEVVRQHPS
jgi:putative N6-adenine-specific DNA methylase